jgi:hypothetical protein
VRCKTDRRDFSHIDSTRKCGVPWADWARQLITVHPLESISRQPALVNR